MRTPWTLLCVVFLVPIAARADVPLIRSARSGPWSAAATWEGNSVPAAGARVQVRTGHIVVYDVASPVAIRSVHIAGTLTFAPDRATRLDVGLLKIQPGDDASENGFDCDAHAPDVAPGQERPALEVGTPEKPIAAGRTALIRLIPVPGQDKETCPAIVCCGGRMDFHGAPLSRTWVKLGATAKRGDSEVSLAERVVGWRVGDRVILTATKLTDDNGHSGGFLSTEERTIVSLGDRTVTLDKPLAHEHLGAGPFRGEIANLSRNVVVESADLNNRGHTMYHKNSAGSISYAEFRHLGKEGLLGKYSLHYHLCGDTMRGSSVVGAAIWDSGNRWLTVHGTNDLVVRDCVGYRSVGHGFFLEDGTEVDNVFDRNLAVQARRGKPLPKQALPFDRNEGSGFWWTNSRNTFTNNVSCENERYGFRYEATKTSRFDLTLPVRQPDGSRKNVDVRTLPFVRFQGNEAHCDGLYGINLGEGVARVGPDEKHPFILRDTKIWEVHYAFRPQAPCVLVEEMTIHKVGYGVYHPHYDRHVYRRLSIAQAAAEPFNRGHDDDSVQYGVLTVDGLTFAGHHHSSHMPLIQISDDNPTGAAVSHFRNVKVVDRRDNNRRALVDLGGGPRPQPKTPVGVPIYLHDWYGPGQSAKVVSTRAKDYGQDGLTYAEERPLTGSESRVAKAGDVAFPEILHPVDDLPPTTVITHVVRGKDGLTVRGTTADGGKVTRVTVNGQPARSVAPNFAEWEATVPASEELMAFATDAAGNVEKRPHVVVLRRTRGAAVR